MTYDALQQQFLLVHHTSIKIGMMYHAMHQHQHHTISTKITPNVACCDKKLKASSKHKHTHPTTTTVKTKGQ
jgi:hypothetical protein